MTLLESVPDSRRGWEGAYSGKGEWVILRLTDIENLVKSYPPECRFLVTAIRIESGDFYPWKSAEWSADVGATFPVELEKPVRSSIDPRVLPNADITPFIRGDAATSPCVGVLIHILPHTNIFRKGIMLSTERQDTRWATPHLVIVRDTPPDDL